MLLTNMQQVGSTHSNLPNVVNTASNPAQATTTPPRTQNQGMFALDLPRICITNRALFTVPKKVIERTFELVTGDFPMEIEAEYIVRLCPGYTPFLVRFSDNMFLLYTYHLQKSTTPEKIRSSNPQDYNQILWDQSSNTYGLQVQKLIRYSQYLPSYISQVDVKLQKVAQITADKNLKKLFLPDFFEFKNELLNGYVCFLGEIDCKQQVEEIHVGDIVACNNLRLDFANVAALYIKSIDPTKSNNGTWDERTISFPRKMDRLAIGQLNAEIRLDSAIGSIKIDQIQEKGILDIRNSNVEEIHLSNIYFDNPIKGFADAKVRTLTIDKLQGQDIFKVPKFVDSLHVKSCVGSISVKHDMAKIQIDDLFLEAGLLINSTKINEVHIATWKARGGIVDCARGEIGHLHVQELPKEHEIIPPMSAKSVKIHNCLGKCNIWHNHKAVRILNLDSASPLELDVKAKLEFLFIGNKVSGKFLKTHYSSFIDELALYEVVDKAYIPQQVGKLRVHHLDGTLKVCENTELTIASKTDNAKIETYEPEF